MSQIESRTLPFDRATLDTVASQLRTHRSFREVSNDGDLITLKRPALPAIDLYHPEEGESIDAKRTISLRGALELFDSFAAAEHDDIRNIYASHTISYSDTESKAKDANVTVFHIFRDGIYELGCDVISTSYLRTNPDALETFLKGLLSALGWADSLSVERDAEGRSVLLSQSSRFVEMLPFAAISIEDQEEIIRNGRVLVEAGGVSARDELGLRARNIHSFTVRGLKVADFRAKLAVVLDYVGRESALTSRFACGLSTLQAYKRFRTSVHALDLPSDASWEVTFWSDRVLTLESVVSDPAIESTSFPWGTVKRGRKPPIDIDVEFDRSREHPFRLWFATRDARVELETLSGELIGDPALISLDPL